jgi:phosphatidylserine decarboxylase
MIHREGIPTIGFIFIISLLLYFSIAYLLPFPWMKWVMVVLLVSFHAIILWFFRNPSRTIDKINDHQVLAPADGKLVVVEEINEDEFFHDTRIKLSIFMSPLNVHVNRYPISGSIEYYKYHPGKYYVAWHPKSSEENERNTTVINGIKAKVLVRQIAGAVARRIVCYAEEKSTVIQGEELGFIKFGSRVDVILPKEARIKVKPGQKITGNRTILAELS